jgi:uncharacterized alpha-E superfamily protein
MLFRNAESLFWVGRYMERAENHARIINVNYHNRIEGNEEEDARYWMRLIDSLGARDSYLASHSDYTADDVLTFITLDSTYENSLLSCVSKARDNLRTLREKLPTELWDTLNAFYIWLVDQRMEDLFADGPQAFLHTIREQAAAFYGMQHSVMAREEEWYFIESGRYLERAENTVRILSSVLRAIEEDDEQPYSYLLTVLKSVSGFQTYRKMHADDVNPEEVIRFLITHPHFPRSMVYAFDRIKHCFEHLEDVEDNEASGKLRHVKLAWKIRADLAYLEPSDLNSENVGPMLTQLLSNIHRLGQMMELTFFRSEGLRV